MGISIEWIRPDVGIARCGPDHSEYSDPYCNSLVIDGQGKVAVYKGLTEPVSRDEWRALEQLLRQRGYRYYARDVVRNGRLSRRVVRKL
jgi:hypothetical protein